MPIWGGGGGGSGTVTSVSFTVPGDIFQATGSPVTESGTLGFTVAGTPGGVPFFSGDGSILSSSDELGTDQLVLGAGTGGAPYTLGSTGTATQVLHGNPVGPPTWGAVSLTADVTGVLPIANGGTGDDIPYFFAGTILPGARTVSARVDPTSAATNTVYTVPTGKKAILLGGQVFFNATGGGISTYWAFVRGGTAYRLEIAATKAADSVTFSAMNGFVFSAGDILALSDAVGGAAALASVLEFDDTARLSSSIITAVAASNTLYTCPANTRARVLTALSMDSGNGVNGNAMQINQSGGAITRQAYHVPRGGAAGASNRLNVAAGVSVANNTAAGFTVPAALNAGDSIVIDLSGTGASQLIALTYIEFPA